MDIYVDVKTKTDGDGSQTRPFRKISEAAAIAVPLVAEGVELSTVKLHAYFESGYISVIIFVLISML